MDVNDENGNGHSTFFSDPPRVLLALAAAALVLGVAAALAFSIETIGGSFGSRGWDIASTTFYVIDSAVFGPAVLLGLLGLLLVRSNERRGQAVKMTRLIPAAAAILVLSGLGQLVCVVGQFLSTEGRMVSGWFVAGEALTYFTSALFHCGVLLGLVYIFRQQEDKYAAEMSSGEDLSGKEEGAGR